MDLENSFDSAFYHKADANGAGNSVDIDVGAVEVDAVFRGVADKALFGADAIGDFAHCAAFNAEFLADTVAAGGARFAAVGFAVEAACKQDAVFDSDRAPTGVGANAGGRLGDFFCAI